MLDIRPFEPVDYLIVGHLTIDLTPDGPRMGGTALYSGLMARALGLRVGIVSTWGGEVPLEPLEDIQVNLFTAEQSTTYENIYTKDGRLQYLRNVAPSLEYYHIPEIWRNAEIVHLAPVAQEVDPMLVRYFQSSMIGITPQGWLRAWHGDGRVYPGEWPESATILEKAGAVVISIEDVDKDESRIDELAASCRVLAVTEGPQGTRLYWNGDVRRFHALEVHEVDATGAGDIFAAIFFTRLYTTRDPWEAARLATQLSAISVTRPGLSGIPTAEEIEANLVEVL